MFISVVASLICNPIVVIHGLYFLRILESISHCFLHVRHFKLVKVIKSFIYVYMCSCSSVCVPHAQGVQKEGIRSPRTRDIGGCEMCDVKLIIKSQFSSRAASTVYI